MKNVVLNDNNLVLSVVILFSGGYLVMIVVVNV